MKLKSNLFKTLIALFALLAFQTNGFAQKEKKIKDKELDTKIFNIQLSEKSEKKKAPKPVDDEISFRGGKMKSKVMDEKFLTNPGMYTVTVDTTDGEKTVTFDFEAVNEHNEKLVWNGTVTGEDITGTIVLSKKEKTKKEWEFTGTQKTKKKK